MRSIQNKNPKRKCKSNPQFKPRQKNGNLTYLNPRVRRLFRLRPDTATRTDLRTNGYIDTLRTADIGRLALNRWLICRLLRKPTTRRTRVRSRHLLFTK